MAGKFIAINRRFWSKVSKTDSCWLWTGSVTGGGYGQIWESLPNRKRHDAHRWSWIMHNGEIPLNLHVLHKCDVKLCVNPDHLYLGTRKDNMRDALERGQKLVGSQCSFAKLSAEQVVLVRELKALGIYTNAKLAQEFDVSPTTIWRAYSGRAYKDVSTLG